MIPPEHAACRTRTDDENHAVSVALARRPASPVPFPEHDDYVHWAFPHAGRQSPGRDSAWGSSPEVMFAVMVGGVLERLPFRECPSCRVRPVLPVPPEWFVDLVKAVPESGPVESWITIHRSGCEAPKPTPSLGASVRVSGACFAVDGVNMG